MNPRRWLLIACALAGTVANAADREFKDVVRAISEEFHTKPMHIPLMGLVNGFVNVAHPSGAKHIEVAIFDEIDYRAGSGRDPVDSVRSAIGRGWKPFIQVRENYSHETVLVYMRENGRDVNLLLATVEANELIVTEVRLDPKALQNFILSPQSSARGWSGAHHDFDIN
jgi:hypothetical protein